MKRRNGHVTLAPNDPARQRAPRRVYGHAPDPKDYPYPLATFDESFQLVERRDAKRLRWQLAVRCKACNPKDGWISLKLWATAEVVHKANYWLSWHPAEQRLASRGDAGTLRRLRPELCAAVEQFMRSICATHKLTALHFSRACYTINGVEQRTLIPYRGITTISTQTRAAAAALYPTYERDSGAEAATSVHPADGADLI